MKHTKHITFVLLGLFLLTQVIGLGVIQSFGAPTETGEVSWDTLPYELERPVWDEETSFIPLIGMVIGVTLVVLLIIMLHWSWVWNIWFFLSVLLCTAITLTTVMTANLAAFVGALLGYSKVWGKHFWQKNLPELFMYGGLAAVFVPVISLNSIIIFLIVISLYDIVAVNKTKHMVHIAESKLLQQAFPGLFLTYGKKQAVLGGGDMGLPLLFTGIMLKTFGGIAWIVPLLTTGALAILLIKSEKNRFYPAMPVLTIGCLVSYILVLLL